ncbi:MAG: transporter substrate-binding domain-containing protein [Oscillospiraceae bacterium]|nr:transporter substrate-binding domain-containing protein [Oscillospiraceae bacterium]
MKKTRKFAKTAKSLAMAAAVIMSACVFSACSGGAKNTVNSIDDLSGKHIGVQLDTVGDIFASDIEGAVVERYTKGADAIQALKQGAIDAVIIDNDPANVFISYNSDIKILDEAFADEEYAIAVQKGNTELLNDINGALAELTAEGVMDNIKANWIGDSATGKPYVFPDGTFPDGGMESTEKLVMATNAEFPPYELMVGEDVGGFDVDMMRAVCAKLNMELEIKNMEFDTIITAVESGTVDVGVAGMTITEERKEKVDFSDPYTTSKQVVVVRK